MKTQNATVEIRLANGLTCKFTLERLKQNDVSINDNVIVKATLFLPAENDCDKLLNQEIRFDGRLVILSETLNKAWGGPAKNENFRFRFETFEHEKWSYAFDNAQNAMVDEIEKLNEAIVKRMKALEDAEK